MKNFKLEIPQIWIGLSIVTLAVAIFAASIDDVQTIDGEQRGKIQDAINSATNPLASKAYVDGATNAITGGAATNAVNSWVRDQYFLSNTIHKTIYAGTNAAFDVANEAYWPLNIHSGPSSGGGIQLYTRGQSSYTAGLNIGDPDNLVNGNFAAFFMRDGLATIRSDWTGSAGDIELRAQRNVLIPSGTAFTVTPSTTFNGTTVTATNDLVALKLRVGSSTDTDVKAQIITASQTNPKGYLGNSYDGMNFFVGGTNAVGGIDLSYDPVTLNGYIRVAQPGVAWGNIILGGDTGGAVQIGQGTNGVAFKVWGVQTNLGPMVIENNLTVTNRLDVGPGGIWTTNSPIVAAGAGITTATLDLAVFTRGVLGSAQPNSGTPEFIRLVRQGSVSHKLFSDGTDLTYTNDNGGRVFMGMPFHARGAVTIGLNASGTPILAAMATNFTEQPPAISAGTSWVTNINLTGAAGGFPVIIGANVWQSGLGYFAVSTNAGQVTVSVANFNTITAITPSNTTFQVRQIQ